MKTRIHKKYRKRGIKKTRRNKVGGDFRSFLGFGPAARVVPVDYDDNTTYQIPIRKKPCPEKTRDELQSDYENRCKNFEAYTKLSQEQQYQKEQKEQQERRVDEEKRLAGERRRDGEPNEDRFNPMINPMIRGPPISVAVGGRRKKKSKRSKK